MIYRKDIIPHFRWYKKVDQRQLSSHNPQLRTHTNHHILVNILMDY
jgi:hypothetical protein